MKTYIWRISMTVWHHLYIKAVQAQYLFFRKETIENSFQFLRSINPPQLQVLNHLNAERQVTWHPAYIKPGIRFPAQQDQCHPLTQTPGCLCFIYFLFLPNEAESGRWYTIIKYKYNILDRIRVINWIFVLFIKVYCYCEGLTEKYKPFYVFVPIVRIYF